MVLDDDFGRADIAPWPLRTGAPSSASIVDSALRLRGTNASDAGANLEVGHLPAFSARITFRTEVAGARPAFLANTEENAAIGRNFEDGGVGAMWQEPERVLLLACSSREVRRSQRFEIPEDDFFSLADRDAQMQLDYDGEALTVGVWALGEPDRVLRFTLDDCEDTPAEHDFLGLGANIAGNDAQAIDFKAITVRRACPAPAED